MDDERDGNLLVGCFWGVLLSIPLWLAFFGWIKLFRKFFF